VAVIPAWWIEALRKPDEGVVLRFMDGPFFMRLTDARAGCWRIECYEDRKERMLAGSYRLPLERIREEVVGAARAVLVASQRRNWKSRDLELLNSLLTNPWLGPTS